MALSAIEQSAVKLIAPSIVEAAKAKGSSITARNVAELFEAGVLEVDIQKGGKIEFGPSKLYSRAAQVLASKTQS